MSKGTSIKEAVAKFEEAEKVKATESKIVKLLGQIPPIEKMDASISTFTACEHLSLSTNMIEKIAYLNGLKNLKILSLARNNIKSLTGLEAVGDTLEELWISYNSIEKLKGINVLKKLKVLFIKNNNIKEQQEFNKIGDLHNLVNLNIIGNPICDSWGESGTDPYVAAVTKVIPKLKTLDGYTVISSQDDEEED